MKNIRTFIISSSLLLAAWLGASYTTEVSLSPIQAKASSSTKVPNTTASKETTMDGDEQIGQPIAQLK